MYQKGHATSSGPVSLQDGDGLWAVELLTIAVRLTEVEPEPDKRPRKQHQQDAADGEGKPEQSHDNGTDPIAHVAWWISPREEHLADQESGKQKAAHKKANAENEARDNVRESCDRIESNANGCHTECRGSPRLEERSTDRILPPPESPICVVRVINQITDLPRVTPTAAVSLSPNHGLASEMCSPMGRRLRSRGHAPVSGGLWREGWAVADKSFNTKGTGPRGVTFSAASRGRRRALESSRLRPHHHGPLSTDH